MELIKGKWYKLSSGKQQLYATWYIKYSHLGGNTVKASEYINDNLRYVKQEDSNFGDKDNGYTFTPIDMQEIAQYLPKNHPDLICQLQNIEIY